MAGHLPGTTFTTRLQQEASLFINMGTFYQTDESIHHHHRQALPCIGPGTQQTTSHTGRRIGIMDDEVRVGDPAPTSPAGLFDHRAATVAFNTSLQHGTDLTINMNYYKRHDRSTHHWHYHHPPASQANSRSRSRSQVRDLPPVTAGHGSADALRPSTMRPSST